MNLYRSFFSVGFTQFFSHQTAYIRRTTRSWTVCIHARPKLSSINVANACGYACARSDQPGGMQNALFVCKQSAPTAIKEKVRNENESRFIDMRMNDLANLWGNFMWFSFLPFRLCAKSERSRGFAILFREMMGSDPSCQSRFEHRHRPATIRLHSPVIRSSFVDASARM